MAAGWGDACASDGACGAGLTCFANFSWVEEEHGDSVCLCNTLYGWAYNGEECDVTAFSYMLASLLGLYAALCVPMLLVAMRDTVQLALAGRCKSSAFLATLFLAGAFAAHLIFALSLSFFYISPGRYTAANEAYAPEKWSSIGYFFRASFIVAVVFSNISGISISLIWMEVCLSTSNLRDMRSSDIVQKYKFALFAYVTAFTLVISAFALSSNVAMLTLAAVIFAPPEAGVLLGLRHYLRNSLDRTLDKFDEIDFESTVPDANVQGSVRERRSQVVAIRNRFLRVANSILGGFILLFINCVALYFIARYSESYPQGTRSRCPEGSFCWPMLFYVSATYILLYLAIALFAYVHDRNRTLLSMASPSITVWQKKKSGKSTGNDGQANLSLALTADWAVTEVAATIFDPELDEMVRACAPPPP